MNQEAHDQSIHDQLVPFIRKGFASRAYLVTIIVVFDNDTDEGVTQAVEADAAVDKIFGFLNRVLKRPSRSYQFTLHLPREWGKIPQDDFTAIIERAVKSVVGETYFHREINISLFGDTYTFQRHGARPRRSEQKQSADDAIQNLINPA